MCNIPKFHFLFVNKLFSRISVYIWIIFLIFWLQKSRKRSFPRRRLWVTDIFAYFFFRRKIKFLKRIRFITRKKATSTAKVSSGLTGARVARNIRGKPKTMAGKFW